MLGALQGGTEKMNEHTALEELHNELEENINKYFGEIGKLNIVGGNVYALCCCVLSLLTDTKLSGAQVGRWRAKRQGANIVLRFTGAVIGVKNGKK